MEVGYQRGTAVDSRGTVLGALLRSREEDPRITRLTARKGPLGPPVPHAACQRLPH